MQPAEHPDNFPFLTKTQKFRQNQTAEKYVPEKGKSKIPE